MFAYINHRFTPPPLGIVRCRHTMHRDPAKGISVAQKQKSELGLAEPCRVRQYGLEHGLKLARRTGDDLKDFGSRRLLLQRLGEFLFQVGVGCAKAVNVSSRLRCLRTKTGNASSTLRPFAS